DVGDSVHLEQVAHILQKRELSRGTTVLRSPEGSATQGVVLRHEPLDLKLGRVQVGSFEADAKVRLFEFAVVAFRFTFAVGDVSPASLMDLSAQLVRESGSFDAKGKELWVELGRQIREAVVPWEDGAAAELMEDFTVFVLPTVPDDEQTLPHVLLGEPASRRLSPAIVGEIARRVIRYYEDDLVLVDYDAAVVVDKEETKAVVDIFEIASAQLLELRFYD